jgi:hypothetical protein
MLSIVSRRLRVAVATLAVLGCFVLASTSVAASAHQAYALPVCPAGTVPSGPEKGAPMVIRAKHNMTCGQVRRAIKRGTWRGQDPRWRFSTRGFNCRVLKVYSGPGVAPGENFACHARGRSFRFGWTT